jgi:hypothetical protein
VDSGNVVSFTRQFGKPRRHPFQESQQNDALVLAQRL